MRKIPQTIRLHQGVLNRVMCTQFCINSLKPIQSEPQYITNKCPTIRGLNRSRQYIMHLIKLSRYFYENHYNKYNNVLQDKKKSNKNTRRDDRDQNKSTKIQVTEQNTKTKTIPPIIQKMQSNIPVTFNQHLKTLILAYQ